MIVQTMYDVNCVGEKSECLISRENPECYINSPTGQIYALLSFGDLSLKQQILADQDTGLTATSLILRAKKSSTQKSTKVKKIHHNG